MSNYQYAKEYLSQAFRLDSRINAKIAQLESCRDLSTKVTGNLTGMPRNPNPNRIDDYISKAIDLEAEVVAELDELISLKAEIKSVIKRVTNLDGRYLLESRYLCLKKWEVLAIDLNVNTRYAHHLHGKALAEVDAILRNRT